MREVQKSSSDYWDAINETSEDYVKALVDFSEGKVVLEEETVAYIANEITEFATGKLKKYGAKFPIANKFYRKENDMKKKKYRVNVHFEGSVDIEVTASDEEQAEELAREVFLGMSEEKIVGYNKENLDTDCEVDEAQQKGEWM